mmetsp:Transcript_39984/g.92077  ORF Transcript_39984/g.92077 Transcript_39984/m.92077 type:complete len:147 (-) Transcript_39984:248-688(-)
MCCTLRTQSRSFQGIAQSIGSKMSYTSPPQGPDNSAASWLGNFCLDWIDLAIAALWKNATGWRHPRPMLALGKHPGCKTCLTPSTSRHSLCHTEESQPTTTVTIRRFLHGQRLLWVLLFRGSPFDILSTILLGPSLLACTSIQKHG